MIPDNINCKVIIIKNSYVSIDFYATVNVKNYIVDIPNRYLTLINLDTNKGYYIEINGFLSLISIRKENNEFVVSCPFIIDRWKKENNYEPFYIFDIFKSLLKGG